MSKSELHRHWTLDPDITFLNHGSFGATPRAVLERQAELRARMELSPVRFFVRELEPLLDEAREALARFLGAAPERLAFVGNATAGVNTVLRSLDWRPDDEILVLDHGYNACLNAASRVARLAVARIPLPIQAPELVVDAVLAAVTPRTRLALLDHVTSPTGLVLPIEELVSSLRERGVETLVDGAHAPGMLPLDLDRLGAAYYTGNCHKWVCAPKGAAFLYARADRIAGLRPLSISHGANSTRTDRGRFLLEFDWTGTSDPTACLCVPAALRHMAGLVPGGWPEIRRQNRELALRARELLNQRLSVAPLCPDSMIGSLAAVRLPDGPATPPASPLYSDPLHDLLFDRYGIEVPIIPWPAAPQRLVRVSAQLYNGIEDYERLARCLQELLQQEHSI